MIPVGSSEKPSRFPWMTAALIVVNWAVFIYLMFFSGAPKHLIERFGFVPAHIFSHSFTLQKVFIYLSAVTACFLHGSILHILGNTLFLWVFGGSIEGRIGPFRYLIFYLLSGVVSMLVQGYAFRNSSLVIIGSSGSIAGIMGAYYILFPKARISTSFVLFIKEIPAIYYLFFWFLFNLIRGFLHLEGKFVEPVAWWAHAGGFLAGAVLINLFAASSGGPAPKKVSKPAKTAEKPKTTVKTKKKPEGK